MHRVRALVLCFASLWAEAACVVGGEPVPSRLEVARAAPEPEAPGVLHADGRGCSTHPAKRPAPPAPDAIWIDATCHYDGTRFVWIPGRYRTRSER